MVTAPEVWPGVKLMTGADLIVAAPWIIFAVVLATICIFLLRARRASRRASLRDRQEPGQDLHPESYPDSHLDSQLESHSDSRPEEER